MLIGNLTRDPELRYTPQGNAVSSFVVATNREWVVEGERKQAADFHNVVSWNKLAEICAELLKKGTKVYVEGRLQTRSWDDTDGRRRYKTEVVISDMIILTQKSAMPSGEESQVDDVEFADEDFDLGDLDLDLDTATSEEEAKTDTDEKAEEETKETEEAAEAEEAAEVEEAADTEEEKK